MKRYLLAAALIALTGCTFKKDPQPAGGDAVSGVVRLSYSLTVLQNGFFDEADAVQTAARQCRQWGYTSAVRFGEPVQTCALYSGPLCMKETVTLEYQCGTQVNYPQTY